MEIISTIEGQTMGGTYRLRLAKSDDNKTIHPNIQQILDRVDSQMSGWNPQSDLMLFNVLAVNEWVDIPAEMAEVVEIGLTLCAKTRGALNICLGNNSRTYGHGSHSKATGGAAPAVTSAGSVLELDMPNLRLRRSSAVALDLNSVAKGYAVDLVSKYLKNQGINNFLIEVAGDIFASGKRPDGMPWTVALELPLPDKSVPLRFIPLYNQAIASSGNYRRFIKSGDEIAGHIIEPETGKAMTEIYASVSVIAKSSAQADGLATALFAMGEKAGYAFADKHNIAAIFISRTADGFKETGTRAL